MWSFPCPPDQAVGNTGQYNQLIQEQKIIIAATANAIFSLTFHRTFICITFENNPPF